jgi:hypothetical protein
VAALRGTDVLLPQYGSRSELKSLRVFLERLDSHILSDRLTPFMTLSDTWQGKKYHETWNVE